MSSCDLCEIARNSVYQSGFSHRLKVWIVHAGVYFVVFKFWLMDVLNCNFAFEVALDWEKLL
jgi:hypothetical protein